MSSKGKELGWWDIDKRERMGIFERKFRAQMDSRRYDHSLAGLHQLQANAAQAIHATFEHIASHHGAHAFGGAGVDEVAGL